MAPKRAARAKAEADLYSDDASDLQARPNTPETTSSSPPPVPVDPNTTGSAAVTPLQLNEDPDEQTAPPATPPKGPLTLHDTVLESVKPLLQSARYSDNEILNLIVSSTVSSSIVDLANFSLQDQQPYEYPTTSKVTDDPTVSSQKKTRPLVVRTNLPPMSDLKDIFEDIVQKVFQTEEGEGENTIRQLISHVGDREIRVGTICSGTESPILALTEFCSGIWSSSHRFEIITDAVPASARLKLPLLKFKHEFSCEIEPFKQAYIERNFHPPVIFRDVREFKNIDISEENPQA